MGLVEPLRSADATASVHRNIGRLIALIGGMVAFVNILTVPDDVRVSLGTFWFLAPQVSVVLATAILAFVCSHFPRLRWIDVIVIFLSGTSAIYASNVVSGIGIVLLFLAAGVANEYGFFLISPRRKMTVAILAALALVVFAWLLIEAITINAMINTVLMIVFLSGAGWQLVMSRVRAERRARRELEILVEERTVDLRKAVDTQRLLLSEIHHRTKNNLQLVASLLAIETIQEDGSSSEAFTVAESRLMAVARTHELLYASTDTTSTHLQTYFESYLRDVIDLAATREIAVVADVNVGLDVSLDIAIRLGLMVNEIVMTTVGTSARDSESSTLELAISEVGDSLSIVAVDDRPGIEIDSGSRGGTGLTIVRSLAETLRGSIELNQESGVRWSISIPLLALEIQPPAGDVD